MEKTQPLNYIADVLDHQDRVIIKGQYYNTKFIVQACNAHDDTVSALEASNRMMYMMWEIQSNLSRKKALEDQMTINSIALDKAKAGI